MPYTRRSYRRKRPFRSRRRRRPVARVPRPVGKTAMTNHFFKRKTINTLSTVSGVHASAHKFALSDLGTYTDLSGLFDQYRISMVVMKVIQRSTSLSMIESNANNVLGMPILFWYIDLDDNTTPTEAGMRKNNRTHTQMFDVGKRVATIKVRPRFANNILDNASGTAQTLGKRSQWIDCAHAQVPHYGVKLYIDLPQSTGTAVEQTFDLVTTYYMQFRHAR